MTGWLKSSKDTYRYGIRILSPISTLLDANYYSIVNSNPLGNPRALESVQFVRREPPDAVRRDRPPDGSPTMYGIDRSPPSRQNLQDWHLFR